jgi:Sulfotransferase family
VKLLIWSVLAAIALVEVLAFFFRLNIWRRRADAIELVAFTFAEARDDHEQQKLLVSAAINLMGLVLYTSLILVVFFYVLMEFPDELNLNDDVFVWTASLSFIGYAWLRASWSESKTKQPPLSETVSQSNGYNRISRWLHWLALEMGLIRRTSFELEKTLYLDAARSNQRIIDQPVYVMGLARSGTTIVLEILEKTGAFHSPTYRDMPFILCPNLWDRLSNFSRIPSGLAHRAHGDGIAIGFDSPESFEEVFWRTATTTLPGPVVDYPAPDDEALDDFAAYRALSVLSAHNPASAAPIRYLSKNNNNLLRLAALSAQQDARSVVIFRDPVSTAWSLYRQHLRFCEIQTHSPFVRAYMRWLGHHEFGLGHKPLVVGVQHLQNLTPQEPDYWLAYWLGVYEDLWQTYSHLPKEQQARILWMSHESMCDHPTAKLTKLFQFVNIEQDADAYSAMLKTQAVPSAHDHHFDMSLIHSARLLHQQILKTVYV